MRSYEDLNLIQKNREQQRTTENNREQQRSYYIPYDTLEKALVGDKEN